ncbi:MAG: DUF1559 domain-containing protein [Planctomycetaceae bacterium]
MKTDLKRTAESSRRRGFTVLELLVTASVTSVLAGLLLPAVQQAREAARKIQCTNQLKQIGLALHNYHDVYQALPVGRRSDALGVTAFGWAFAILPQLELSPLAVRIDDESAVTSPVNEVAREQSPNVFRCPSDPQKLTFALYEEEDDLQGVKSLERVLAVLPSANYIGVFGTSEPDDPDETPSAQGEGTFLGDRSIQFRDLTRGLSNVAIVGERTARKLPVTWFGVVLTGEDACCRLLGNAGLGPNRDDADECEFDSRHPGCANFLWGDGHVRSISDSIDSHVYREFATRY